MSWCQDCPCSIEEARASSFVSDVSPDWCKPFEQIGSTFSELTCNPIPSPVESHSSVDVHASKDLTDPSCASDDSTSCIQEQAGIVGVVSPDDADKHAVLAAARSRAATYKALGITPFVKPVKATAAAADPTPGCPYIDACLQSMVTPGVALAANVCACDIIDPQSHTVATSGPSDLYRRRQATLTANEVLLQQACAIPDATSVTELIRVFHAIRNIGKADDACSWTGLFSACRVSDHNDRDQRRARRSKRTR